MHLSVLALCAERAYVYVLDVRKLLLSLPQSAEHAEHAEHVVVSNLWGGAVPEACFDHGDALETAQGGAGIARATGVAVMFAHLRAPGFSRR